MLPTVLTSSVIRSTRQSESHGGVYLVDLDPGTSTQVIDWDDPSIDWSGRGGDRGLRGIAFYDTNVLLAASDEIFVYDKDFEIVDSFKNRYLKHCHEIFVAGNRLYVTSTGYDSVLVMNLDSGIFESGYMFRYSRVATYRRRRGHDPKPRFRKFDPMRARGPRLADTTHLNNVYVTDESIFVAGALSTRLFEITKTEDARTYATLPRGSHNARPFRDGVLTNDTRANVITYQTTDGRVLESFRVPHNDDHARESRGVRKDHARAGFGRGLCLADDLLIGGSSPATVSVYEFGREEPVTSVILSTDVRNSIHGLEIWPYT